MILDPTDGTVGAAITVTVQAQDDSGNVNTSYQTNVTLVTNGSATGAGVVDITNGVGTLDISDAVAETVNLSLTDSETTGLDVSSTQDVVFGPGAAATKVRVETAADGNGTVVGAQDVVSGSSIAVYAITRDASDNFVANVAADTWSLTGKTGEVADGDLVPEPDDKSAVFTGALVGTAVIHVTSGELAGDSGTITVNGATNNTNVTNETVFTATSGDATVTGSFSNNLTGWINTTAIGNATNSSEVNQSNPRHGLGSGDKVVSGITINVSDDSNILSELDNRNGTIRIQICYNATTLTALGIDASTLAIWKYNITTETWVKQSSTTTSEGCVYADVKHLCPLGLFGSKATPSGSSTGGSGGSGGTYPPGWFGTPTVTATKAPAATTTATDAPPGDKVAPAPTKRPEAAKTTTPAAEGTTAETAKNGAPGFTAVFVIAGVLAVAYAMMRRRS